VLEEIHHFILGDMEEEQQEDMANLAMLTKLDKEGVLACHYKAYIVRTCRYGTAAGATRGESSKNG
jgi:hypothetical protein